jgi:hypothetical protein
MTALSCQTDFCLITICSPRSNHTDFYLMYSRYSNLVGFLSDRNTAFTYAGRGKISACSQLSHHFVSPGRFLSDYRSHLRFDHTNFCLIITDPRILYFIGLTYVCLQRFHLCSDRTAFWLIITKSQDLSHHRWCVIIAESQLVWLHDLHTRAKIFQWSFSHGQSEVRKFVWCIKLSVIILVRITDC